MRPAFEAAAAADKPILAKEVSEKYRDAWAEFTGGTIMIPNDPVAIREW